MRTLPSPALARLPTGGFSLIELMIVVALFALLAMIAVPAYQESVRKSRRAEAYNALAVLQQSQGDANGQSGRRTRGQHLDARRRVEALQGSQRTEVRDGPRIHGAPRDRVLQALHAPGRSADHDGEAARDGVRFEVRRQILRHELQHRAAAILRWWQRRTRAVRSCQAGAFERRVAGDAGRRRVASVAHGDGRSAAALGRYRCVGDDPRRHAPGFRSKVAITALRMPPSTSASDASPRATRAAAATRA